MDLVVARRNLAASEELLALKRKEAIDKRKDMNRQWKELEEKEASLKQSFIKFNKVYYLFI